jgi:hypothetical protein
MDALGVLNMLRCRGMLLSPSAGKLVVEFNGEMADSDRGLIRVHRDDLLALLEHEATAPSEPATWPPRSLELATWPVSWRERWGRLANRLEDGGMNWNDAEREAFRRLKAEKDAFGAVNGPVEHIEPHSPSTDVIEGGR